MLEQVAAADNPFNDALAAIDISARPLYVEGAPRLLQLQTNLLGNAAKP